MNDIAAWAAFAEKLGKAGYEILRTADVKKTAKGFYDEKFLAVTLLARTMSNLKAALLLLQNKRIVEARTITRCCLEPVLKDEEIAETLQYFCLAVMGVCVSVNQILDGTPGGNSLNKLADEYMEHSNNANAKT